MDVDRSGLCRLEDRWQQVKTEAKNRFPATILGFGYGSGVIPQSGYEYSREQLPLVDMMFVVKDAADWHRENYKINREHYRGNLHLISGLSRLLGWRYVNFVTNTVFPIAFFPDVEISKGVKGKYGVVEKSVFEDDLKDW